ARCASPPHGYKQDKGVAIMSARDLAFMNRASALAFASYEAGGCPIGGVLVDNDGNVLGEGHNMLVQEGNPIIHGEMAALRAAGGMSRPHRPTVYTTLQPCVMCNRA